MKFYSTLTSILNRWQLLKAPLWFILAVAVTLTVLWSPLMVRWQGLMDPYSFNGDALQHIAPMWFVHTSPASMQDYTLRYYLEAILPPLFKVVYALSTLLFTPAATSKLLTVILSAVFIATSALTARRLGGWPAGSLALFLATGGVLKHFYFMGGIQRGFGFCIMSVALYCVCCGRIKSLAVLGIVAAMLYPAAAVCILVILGLLVAFPGASRGPMPDWHVRHRFGLLILTTLLIGIAVTPQLIGGRKYGERLSIGAESQFEEWGPHGRYTPGDRGVPVSLLRKSVSGAAAALAGTRLPKDRSFSDTTSAEQAALGVITLSLLGALLMAVTKRRALAPEAIRCGVFFIGTVVAFLAASALFPLLYIPSRYIALGVTALTPVVFPAIWSSLVQQISRRFPLWFANALALVLGALIIVALGWLQLSPKRLPTAVGNRALFAFIRGLPENVVIASWPRGIANMIPLFTARSTLIFEEGHQIFHRDVLEEMRRRTRAVIAVYAATDMAPIRDLQRTFNVSHLLVNKRHLKRTPDYFAPFGREIEEARTQIGATPLVVEELVKTRAVFSDNDYVLIDLQGPL